jgi:hypothetical protein
MKLNVEIGLTVCDYPFPIIAETAQILSTGSLPLTPRPMALRRY